MPHPSLLNKLIFYSFFGLLINLRCLGQDLVFNGSFELHKKCPNQLNQLSRATGWYNPSSASPDYFYRGENKNTLAGVPDNQPGKQQPHSGNGYVGIVCYGENPEYREYIETKLLQPLKEDSLYHIKFYVSRANKERWACNRIGAYFSAEYIHASILGVLKELPQIESDSTKILTDTTWVEISGIYKAKGGEKYFTIGNFFNNKNTKVKALKRFGEAYAYYYIDDISLTEIKNSIPSERKSSTVSKIDEENIHHIADTLLLNKSYVLNNIYFDSDKSEMLPSSFTALNELTDLLNKNLSMEIEIDGFTDTIGSVNYDQFLSEERAKAVMDYLVSRGISVTRLSYKGYGSDHAIATNSTEEGRLKNRRVEFKIVKLNK